MRCACASVGFAVGTRIGLETEHPLVAEADDLARATAVQAPIMGGEDGRRRPRSEVAALAPSGVQEECSIVFDSHEGEVQMEQAFMIGCCRIGIHRSGVPSKQNR